ncbi:iron-sulfur cluster assembly ATPase SufC [Paratrimastix pyriformis]|uniref:Iron-sulfur cluster assembly ATPase SufC n=2 Tax=Paratrimastix pyriformis TaxID=342808 RepID=A0ABQ8UCB6_9EUKA|nr:iron-sulfur cluster assembly ATPase SufC [Paratrimastix pyriformis]
MATPAPLLQIRNLQAEVTTDPPRQILKGINLTVRPGEVHAIMGPNGSGKSTLASVLSGGSSFRPTSGSVEFCGQSLLELKPEERAHLGLFIGFQYPPAIPGVANEYFLRTSVNAMRLARGQPIMDAAEFGKTLEKKMGELNLSERFMTRGVNEGFSGGEKKRNEILQMALLEPRVAILDEIDSGLDIDALKVVADGVNMLRQTHPEMGLVLITHWQRLLSYIVPTHIHVLAEGRIVHSGGPELAHKLEESGYDPLVRSTPAPGTPVPTEPTGTGMLPPPTPATLAQGPVASAPRE